MKRKQLAKIVVMALVLALIVGCSSNSGNANPQQGSVNHNGSGGSGDVSKDKVEISLWLTPQWKGVFDSSEDGADFDSFFKYAAEKFIDQYEKYDVTVNVEVVAGDQRDELLNVNLNGGTPPDIFFESIFAMGDYVHRGAMVPLNDIVDDAARSDIADNFWEGVTFGGDIYFYPFQHNPGTLVYNADMFRAAGLDAYIGGETEIKTWTLEEYEFLLETLKNDLPEDQYSNAYPMALFALNNQGDTWNLAYLRMFGNKFFDDQGNIVLNDDSGIKAAEWLKKIYDAGYTNPGAESVSSNDTNAMFQNQQLGISFTNPILFNNILADMEAGNVAPFDARIANIPSASGDPLSFTYIVGASVFDTKDEKRIEVAKDFVQFFSSDEELVEASKNGIPVRTTVADKFKNENPFFSAYDANAKYMFNFTGNVPGYNQLRQVLYPELQALFLGSKSPADVVRDYQENGNRVISEAKKMSVIYGN